MFGDYPVPSQQIHEEPDVYSKEHQQCLGRWRIIRANLLKHVEQKILALNIKLNTFLKHLIFPVCYASG